MLLHMAKHFILFYGWLIFHYRLYHIFIHTSVDAHMGCFCILAIVKSAAKNIGVHILDGSFWITKSPYHWSCLALKLIKSFYRSTKNSDTMIYPISVQLLSCVRLFVTPWTTARQASPSITNSRSPPKPMSIEWLMPSNHLIPCRPLLLLPSIFPGIRVFLNESALCIRWPNCWSFSFNISLSNEHPGLVSFRMDWLDLLAVQGTLKSLLQHHSSKTSILRHLAFFIVQLSHPYMTTL